MARLPSAVDIQRRPAPAQTPDVRVPRIDFGPEATASQALGQGVQSVGKAVDAYAKAAEETQAHEIERRLTDFKLDTEMEYENYKRSMPPGAEGYGQSWAAQYRERATAFVGEKYANIPERLRPQVDKVLQGHDVMLHERAQRDEFAERDRQTIADLETTLGKTRSAVEANPGRLEEMHAEGRRLIDGARLPPATRSVYAKKYREALDDAAAASIADGVVDAESYAKAKEILAPHKAERVTARGVSAEIKREADGMAVISAGSGARFRVNADHAARFQGLVADLEAAGVEIKPEQSGGYANRNIAGTSKKSEHAFGRAIDLNWSENARGTAGKLDPELARSLAAKHGLKWGGDWKNPDPMHFEVDPSAAPSAPPPVSQRSITAFAGHGRSGDVPVGATDPDAYDGPLQSLSLAKRRAHFARAEANFDKVRKGTEHIIKEQMSVAADGYLPPEPILKELDRRVRALGDPMIAAQYDAMLRNAQLTRAYQKAPPLAIEEEARRLREMAATNGATKEMDGQIKHVETLAESVRRNVNDDPMGWAARSQISVPVTTPGASGGQVDAATARAPLTLDQIDFRSDTVGATLARRMDQAKAVGAYYGQPPAAFTKNEREFLKDTLRQGGKGALFVLGQVAKAASDAGIEPMQVMREFSKDAPEVGVIGQMVASNADPRILDTAANALAWKTKMGEKFESTIDKVQAKPDLAEYSDVLSATPTTVDAVKHTANLIYEYEARRQGLKEFKLDVYHDVVRRVMGETKMPDGTVYGGVGRQGTGWTDGKWGSNGWFGTTPKVLVPAEIRQDAFDDMVGALRAKDLPQQPVDAAGKPLTIGQVRSASWISIGPGRYALELKRDADGTRAVAMGANGQPYVLDVRPILPAIQRRKPEIFRGYDGSQRPVVEPE